MNNQMDENPETKKPKDIVLKGIPVSKGYASGKAFIIKRNIFNLNQNGNYLNPSEEIERFKQTIVEYKNELLRYQNSISKEKSIATDILDSIKLLLEDPDIEKSVIEYIHSGKSAELAVELTYQKFEKDLLSVKNKFIRERAFEIEQIKNRFLELLINKKLSTTIPENSIVVAPSLSADQVIAFKEKNVAALITEVGGTTTHSSILARSFRIPSVIGIPNATKLISNNDHLLVDAYKGIIIVNPTQETYFEFKEKVEDENYITKELGDIIYRPTQTKDGKPIELQANINYKEELDEREIYLSDGIGLVRTEHLVPIRDFYDKNIGFDYFEQVQYELYHDVAVKVYPKPVIFRAFDLGGDKFPSLFGMTEANPMLGFRGIRYLLANPRFFKTQLRAFLRASVEKNVQIMIPMVTTLEEVLDSLRLIEECKEELKQENQEFDPNVKFGIMIETPAAALQSDILANYVDFISIGTNDLTQYTLVADRDNSQVSSYFSPFHPSVLKLMKYTINNAKRKGKKVGICGELASHPAATGLIIGLEFDSISVSVENLLQVKKWISEIDSSFAKAQLQKALRFSTSEQVREFLEID
ncbi:MAG: phosphoenolpyruvate--protein phosphotransferase [Ignavibacteria bacterium]|nr:phosphoenolpyruvate--protein phosphotransferase [Ignavibacteria bacterium]